MQDETITRREVWMSAAAFVFILGYTGVVLRVSPLLNIVAWVVLGAVWLFFAVDLVIRAVRGGRAFWRARWWEVLVLVFPVLKALQSVGLVRQMRVFRPKTPEVVRRRFIVQLVAAAVVFIYVSSLTAYRFEGDVPGATIDSWGNAVWWTIVTMATVGYGDITPLTIAGRMVAVLDMAAGIAVVGVASATVVNYLTQMTDRAK